MSRSLRFWLSIGLASLVTAAVVTVIAIVLGVLVPRLNDEVEAKNRALGEAVAGQIEGFLTRSAASFQRISREIEASPGLSGERLRQLVDTNANTDAALEALYVVNWARRTIEVGLPGERRGERANLVGLDFSGRRFLDTLRPGDPPVWSDTYLSARGRMVVAIAVPLQLPADLADPASRDGFLVGEIDLADISRFAQQVGESGKVLPIVVDRRGDIVGHPDVTRSLRQENIGHLSVLQAGNGSRTRTATFVLDDIDYLGTRTRVATTGWTALVAQPVDEAFATVRATLTALAAAAGISLLLALVTAFLASRRMTRQVAEFGTHLESVANGNYHAAIPRSNTDEIERLAHSMRRMADAVLEREARLRASETQYRQVVEGTQDLITRVDTEGRLTFVNPMAQTYFGLSPDACLGRLAFDFVHPDDRKATQEAFAGWLAQGTDHPARIENRQVAQDGTVHLMQWNVVADLENGHGTTPPRLTGFTSIGRDITAQHAAEQLLAASEERYRGMFQKAPLPYQSLAMDTTILDVNDAWLDLFGLSARDQAIGRPITDFILDRSLPVLADHFPRFLSRGHVDGPVFDIHRADGQQRTVVVTGRTSDDPHQGKRTHCILTDITERLRLEAEQRRVSEQLQLAASVFSASAEGICITDANKRIISVNPALVAITGYSAAEVIGQTPALFSSGRHDAEFYRQMWVTISDDGFWRGEIWNRRKSGEIYPEWLTITAVRDPAGQVTHYIGSFFDISDRKQQEEHIQFMAHHDALTRLPNRTLLDDRIRQAIAKSRRNGDHSAVLFVDLDRFKLINDTLGHDVGDRLLEEVARRLQAALRETETVARLGGDEFVIVIPELADVDRVVVIAEKLIATIAEPVDVEERRLHVTPSIGISIYPDDGTDPATLLKNADTAMYHAKERGRNNYQFFTAAMNLAVQERVALEDDLRRALRNGEFELFYQPQVNGVDGQAFGLEALIRWRHPVRGLVPPDRFIPIAEETGQIVAIGEWVLMEACRQTRRWHDAGFTQLTIGVNLSARQFQSAALFEHIGAALAASGLPAQALEVELTESMLMADPLNATQLLQRLAELGIRMAIDDFGTGYSSLAYLKLFPVSRLKIDRSFVRDLTSDPNDAAIVEAVIAMARSLKMAVIAEGVETEQQLHYLIGHGCNAIQGYYFSRPRPAQEFDGTDFRFSPS